jgi:CheY-like chemotaxis protein/Tfp pilus assembly protein PilF
MIDRDIHTAKALLVEGNNLLRSVTAAQLRDAGIGHVSTAARVREARVMLEQQPFDIVVCNREFEGSDDSGQDLLDELRREHLLPHSTVFLMVTAKAVYHQVVEAAEGALDGLLLRPYTAANLCQRIQEARQRKRELADVLRALDAGEHEVAFAHALKRFQDRMPYGTYCGRLAAELLITMDRPEDAHKIFDKLYELSSAPWARLGAARAELHAGDTTAARRTLSAVLQEHPKTADAHDLLGRLLVEQCDFDGALEQYRAAATLTPGCLLRAQHAGALAFYQGRGPEARQWLERTVGMGVHSKLFDALSLLLLCVLRYDDGDLAGVAATGEQLRAYRTRYPDSIRLRRLERAAATLGQRMSGDNLEAQSTLSELSAEAGDDSFDLEAANTLLTLWARMPAEVQQSPEHEALVERIGMRFCVAKAIGEVLVAAARRAEPAMGVIRRCQAQVLALSEQAMARALRGDAATAAHELLAAGERTLNAKLLELAGLIARRHQSIVPDADALAQRAQARVQRSSVTTHIAGIQRSGRSPGGLQLRGRRSPQEARSGTS